jgi:hypothetical protein
MSTIKVDTIKDTNNVEVYTCKAWVNFNGTGTIAIRESGNVSSLTDISTGRYDINFTTAMSDANYSTVCGGYGGNPCTVASTPTTSSVQVISFYNGSNYDVAQVTVAVFR